MNRFSILVEKTDAGLYRATSPEYPELNVAGRDRVGALVAAADALHALFALKASQEIADLFARKPTP